MSTNEAINAILQNAEGKSSQEITRLIDEKLSEPGAKGVREEWTNTRTNDRCTNPGNVEAQKCYRVNHGDGSYSETWCDDWHCL